MKHLDLFSGIGGFALSAQWVWGEEHKIHSFVEIDPFCQKVLKKHWPEVPILSDIKEYKHDGTAIDLLTGGFPCQPFSRDRVWIVANRTESRLSESRLAGIGKLQTETGKGLDNRLKQHNSHASNSKSGESRKQTEQEGWENISGGNKQNKDASDTSHKRLQGSEKARNFSIDREKSRYEQFGRLPDWQESWLEVATRLCRVDDGLSRGMDRVNRLKALGNAIVPQVVVPIMQAIKRIEAEASQLKLFR